MRAPLLVANQLGQQQALARSSSRRSRTRGRSWCICRRGASCSIATRQHGPARPRRRLLRDHPAPRRSRLGRCVADVCGNGPSAAVPVSRLRWLLRQHLARGEAPGAVLALLNDAIVAGNEPDLFVTAVCVRIDPLSGAVTVASAGHLGPFIKRACGDAQELVTATGRRAGDHARPDLRRDARRAGFGGRDRAGHRRHHRSAGHRVEPARSGRPAGRAGARASVRRVDLRGAAAARPTPIDHDATVVVLQLPRRHRRITPVRTPRRASRSRAKRGCAATSQMRPRLRRRARRPGRTRPSA